MTHPLGEARKQRAELLKLALSQAMRERMTTQQLQKTKVARRSHISPTFLRSILRAKKGCSLSVFLELSDGLSADPCELLNEVLTRRDALRER